MFKRLRSTLPEVIPAADDSTCSAPLPHGEANHAGDFRLRPPQPPRPVAVIIKDEDFRPLVPDNVDENSAYDDLLYDAANWDNVPALLTLPGFNLESRLTPPAE